MELSDKIQYPFESVPIGYYLQNFSRLPRTQLSSMMYIDVYGCIWMYIDVYGCI